MTPRDFGRLPDGENDLDGTAASTAGAVTAVRGGVVDIRFADDLPEIHRELRVDGDRVVIEVLAQLDDEHVRGVALTDTRGLARGDRVRSTGRTVHVPVGPDLRGRMVDVFGRPLDGEEPPGAAGWRPQLRPPVPLIRQVAGGGVMETGIKVIDLLSPLERGGKAGLFGGPAWARPSSSWSSSTTWPRGSGG